MHQINLLVTNQAAQPVDQRQLAQRIQAAPLHRRRQPAKPQGTQLFPIRPRRRQQQHLMPRIAQSRSQRAPEVIEIPLGIGEQDNFQNKASRG